MSRPAHGSDHAVMESFFDTLKRAGVTRTHFLTQAQARSAIFAYLECFSHPIRLHSTLQSISPLVYEHAFVPLMRSPTLDSPPIWVMVNVGNKANHTRWPRAC